MNKKLTVGLATATLLLLAACGQQADSTKTSSNSHSTTQSEKRAKKQSELKLRAQSSAKKQASEASAKAMSESREKAALAASTAAAQAAEAASSASASEQAADGSSASAAQQAKQSAIKPITKAEAIEAEKKAFDGSEYIVIHNGTFSSQPDGSMTAHDYSGAQGEDFWNFTPNADGTITVLSKFGSVKGGEQQIETHVVPR